MLTTWRALTRWRACNRATDARAWPGTQDCCFRASRLFSLLVGASALLVAGFGASKLASDAVDAWTDGKELALGVLVLAGMLIGYAVARRMHQAAAADGAVAT